MVRYTQTSYFKLTAIEMHKKPSNYTHSQAPVTGVLITNLGTPDAPTASALKTYLKEFLWDPRVVEIPRLPWWVILHGFILTTRPKKSAEAYQKVWTSEGSPLLSISKQQQASIQKTLEEKYNGPVKVALGMRYGSPSIKSALNELRHANAQRIVVLPLYPQHSAATTASTFDAIASTLKDWRYVPELRFINQYHDDENYINAVANSIKNYWKENGKPKKLLFSFHGMPARTLTAGDPYFCHCQKTARLIIEKLELTKDEWIIAFQSRFGKEEWLKPYANTTLETLGNEGLESIDVVCPGFSADCLETLEEMVDENKLVFKKAGGGDYRYIPALNNSPEHINALSELILHHTKGWPVKSEDDNQQESTTRCQRATDKGALQ